MPTLIVTTTSGKQERIEAAGGLSVMEVIRNGGGVDLLAMCGGCCACATSRVLIHPDLRIAYPRRLRTNLPY
jgi:2Fe-2S ferredoxin